jgi:uncharacterized protein
VKNLALIIVFSSSFLLSFSQNQKNVPLPEMDARIMDLANLLTADQKKSIFDLMRELESRVGSVIGIVTIETLNGMSIEEYAKTLANQMAVRGKKRDGILIVFAYKDRLFRTEVSVGLDKIITNDFSNQINQLVISPEFAVQRYGAGFYNGIRAFKDKIEANKDLIGK